MYRLRMPKFLAPGGRHVYQGSVASSASKTSFGIYGKTISARFPLQRSGMSIE